MITADQVLDLILRQYAPGGENAPPLRRRLDQTDLLQVLPHTMQTLVFRNTDPTRPGIRISRVFDSGCIIDHLPVIKNGQLFTYNSCLIAILWKDRQRRELSFVHELVHMFSSGAWRIDRDEIIHVTGIAEHIYEIENGAAVRRRSRNVQLNERITDLLAEEFLIRISDSGHDACFDPAPSELCRRYFSNDVTLAGDSALLDAAGIRINSEI